MGTVMPAHVEPDDSTHVTIVDDRNSSVCESSTSRPSDTGHERLLHKQPSSDGRSISHCRASKPPNYLGFAILVSNTRRIKGFLLMGNEAETSYQIIQSLTRGSAEDDLS